MHRGFRKLIQAFNKGNKASWKESDEKLLMEDLLTELSPTALNFEPDPNTPSCFGGQFAESNQNELKIEKHLIEDLKLLTKGRPKT